MNLQEAKALKPGDTVYHKARNNADGTPMRARVTSVKIWKRSPNKVEVRVKRGIYEYARFREDEIYVLTTDETVAKRTC